MEKLPFKKIRSGYTDATKEYQENEDDFVLGFYDWVGIKNLIYSDEYYYISGRKGSGKTALALKLLLEYKKDNSGFLAKLVNADQIFFRDIVRFENVNPIKVDSTAGETRSYVVFWQFIILTKYFEIVYEAFLNKKSVGVGKKRINELVRKLEVEGVILQSKLNKKKKISGLSEMFSFARNTENKRTVSGSINAAVPSVVSGGVALSVSNEAVQSSLEQFGFNSIVVLCDELAQLLSEVEIEGVNQVVLLMDSFDESLNSYKNNRRFEAMINGLLQAVNELNDKTASDQFVFSFKTLLFLRDELFTVLENPNASKIKTDRTLGLKWSEDDLLRMISKKILVNSYTNHKEYEEKLRDNPQYLFSQYFPQKINMYFGTDKRTYEDFTSQFLIHYSLMRPRDLMYLFTVCRKHYPNDVSIDNKKIYMVLKKYSSDILSEFEDEFTGFYSRSEVKSIEQALYKKQNNFSFEEFQKNLDMYSKTAFNSIGVLEKLIERGYVGYRHNGMGEVKYNTLQKYHNHEIKPQHRYYIKKVISDGLHNKFGKNSQLY